jgi:hypothetical protein
MSYPPPVLPINKTNASPQQDAHPAEHNAIGQAINDVVAVLGADPAGGWGSLTARLASALPQLIRGTNLPGQTIPSGQSFNVATYATPAGPINRWALLVYIGLFGITGDPVINYKFKDGGGTMRFQYTRYPAVNNTTVPVLALVALNTAAETYAVAVECGGTGASVIVGTDGHYNAAFGLIIQA